MPPKRSYESLHKMAQNFATFKEFRDLHPHEAYALKQFGLLSRSFPKTRHEPTERARAARKADLAVSIKALALNFTTKIDFYRAHPKEYAQARYLNIFDEATSHMVRTYSNPYGSMDNVAQACKEHETLVSLRGDRSLYSYVKRHDLINTLCAHMPDRNHVFNPRAQAFIDATGDKIPAVRRKKPEQRKLNWRDFE